ncbi:hypothetical protein JCM39194_17400 [Desulfotomaculum varum]
MYLRNKYETWYICSKIHDVKGERYNLGLKLAEDEKPEISGYCYPETIAGFFRAWLLNEMHLQLLITLNKFQVLTAGQLTRLTGLNHTETLKLLEEGISRGIFCRNTAVDSKWNQVFDSIYIVDTGGIFALQEAGIPYQKLPYTSSFDERINIARRNIYAANEGIKNIPNNLLFFEDIVERAVHEGVQSLFKDKVVDKIILYDGKIADELGIKDQVQFFLAKLSQNNKVYDLSEAKENT